jgi:hypothetical protein
MYFSFRLVGMVRFAIVAVLVLLSCSWLVLYLDSVYQRQMAEIMLSDLKLLPFETAGFAEVRDFVNRHGGTVIQQFPNVRFLPPPLPQPPRQGHWEMSLSSIAGPICTYRDCALEISYEPYLYRLVAASYLSYPSFANEINHIGFCPWLVTARFQIVDGKLWDSQVRADQIKHSKWDSFEGFDELIYDVSIHSVRHGLTIGETPGYWVGVPTRTGGSRSSEFLTSWHVQPSNVPISRSINLDLHCFTVVSRRCTGISEIAPTAWADYQQEDPERFKAKGQLLK